MLECFRELSADGEEKQLYEGLFQPDVDAAIATRDMPRLARSLYHFLNLTYLKHAIEEKHRRNEADARIRDAGAHIPFDLFCMLWHELPGGTPTARAKHVAAKAGGDYRNHRNRYYCNRVDVDDWEPPDE